MGIMHTVVATRVLVLTSLAGRVPGAACQGAYTRSGPEVSEGGASGSKFWGNGGVWSRPVSLWGACVLAAGPRRARAGRVQILQRAVFWRRERRLCLPWGGACVVTFRPTWRRGRAESSFSTVACRWLFVAHTSFKRHSETRSALLVGGTCIVVAA